MKHLVIIGAGGYGREMLGAAMGAVGFGVDFDVKGFLDARADALDGFRGYPPIIGTPEGYAPQAEDVFITALGSIASRRKCAEQLERRGAKFISIVHKTATLGPNVEVGAGSFIAPNVTLTADIRIGRHAAVFHNSSVGHDSVLDDFSHVYAQCAIGGAIHLGAGAVVYPGAVIVPRRTIGENAVVGAGSTVVLNVRPGVTVFGSPAREVK